MSSKNKLSYRQVISSMVILVDTREKQWNHIKEYFDENKIKYRREKLDSGDYSFEITVNGKTYSYKNRMVIERKRNLDELAQCFTSARQRFERELARIKVHNTECVLLVEDDLSNMYTGNYRSRLVLSAFESSLLAWFWKYNFIPLFVNKKFSGRVIYKIFYYYIRNGVLYKFNKNDS